MLQHPRQRQQMSLLKPKGEGLSSEHGHQKRHHAKEHQLNDNHANEVIESLEPPKKITPAISSSRLNLRNALNKAKVRMSTNNTAGTSQAAIIADSNVQKNTNSSSSSSSASASPSPSPTPSTSPLISDESYDVVEMYEDEDESGNQEQKPIRKEDFLQIFGLYTHEHSKYLQTRRSERRRRSVKNTEKTDFHYGRFDVMEMKRVGKRGQGGKMVLYSPPATRSFRKRRRNDAGDTKSTTSSSSGSVSDEKVCSTCHKGGML